MPQFAHHTPKTPSDMRKGVTLANLQNPTPPIGVIAERLGSEYGYNGRTYYVVCGFFGELATTGYMSFTEAKALYDAIGFFDWDSLPEPKKVTAALKAGRKKRLRSVDEWLFHYRDSF